MYVFFADFFSNNKWLKTNNFFINLKKKNNVRRSLKVKKLQKRTCFFWRRWMFYKLKLKRKNKFYLFGKRVVKKLKGVAKKRFTKNLDYKPINVSLSVFTKLEQSSFSLNYQFFWI